MIVPLNLNGSVITPRVLRYAEVLRMRGHILLAWNAAEWNLED